LNNAETTTRCLHCSLACPLAVERRHGGIVQPFYAGSTDSSERVGLCYRGHYVAALMVHNQRLTRASRGSLSREKSGGHSGVMKQAAELIRDAGANNSLGVLISGNLPGNEIGAAVRFFQTAMPARNVSVFVPPTDTAILSGLARSGCELAEREDIAQARSVLAVGDVLGTHPVLAGELFDARDRNRRSNLINIDTIQGRTMRFANMGLLIKHGGDTQAILALAKIAGADLGNLLEGKASLDELLNDSGISRDDAERCVEMLRGDKNSLILLTIPAGRCGQSELLAAATGALAQGVGSKVLGLFSWAGSPGAYAIANSMKLTDVGGWLNAARNGEFSTAFIVGVDLVGVLPDELAGQALDKTENVITASAMPNATTDRADITLPLAFWFEMDGEVIDHKGNSIALNALGEAPGGAGSLVEMVDQLAKSVGVEGAAGVDLNLRDGLGRGAGNGKFKELPAIVTAGDDSFVVTSRTENLELYEGSISRQLDWPLTMEPKPMVLLNPADARNLKLQERDMVSLGANGSEVELCVRISDAVPGHSVAINAAIPGAQNLFACRTEGSCGEIEPGQVKLAPVDTE